MTKIQENPVKGIFRLRGLTMTRLETFTDAAFAFALTLLVISLEPPASLGELRSALRDIPAFVASGALLMLFWWGHHEWSRRYGLDDGPTVVLSCILVFTVLVYVVPLRYMFGLFFLWLGYLTGLPLGSAHIEFGGPAEVNTMFAIYGVGFTCMAGALVLLYVHAWRRRDLLELSPVEVFETLAEAGVWGIVGLVGVISVITAVTTPPTMVGIPGWVYMLLPLLTGAYGLIMNRRRDRLFTVEAGASPTGEVEA